MVDPMHTTRNSKDYPRPTKYQGVRGTAPGVFQARFRHRGITGSKSFATARDAFMWIQDSKDRIDTGTYNGGSGHGSAKSRYSLSDWVSYWVRTDKAPDVVDATLNNIENILAPVLAAEVEWGRRKLEAGDIDLEELTPKLVTDALKVREGQSQSTVKRTRSTLVRCLDFAVSQEVLKRNPAVAARTPKAKDPVEGRAHTIGEMERLLATASETDWYALYVVGFWLGLRPGELAALRWSDLDPAKKTLSIQRSLHVTPHRQTRKQGRPATEPAYRLTEGSVKKSTYPHGREVKVDEVVLDALKAHREGQAKRFGAIPGPDDLVFPSRAGTFMDLHNLRRVVRNIAAKAGVDGLITTYNFRHTCATQLIDAGKSFEEVAHLFGDNVETIVKHYKHRVKKVADAGTGMTDVIRPKLLRIIRKRA